MSFNIFEIHIQTERLDEVKEFLADWLSQTHGEKPQIEDEQDSFFPFFKKELAGLFAVSILHQNWVTVLHDSYEPPFELAGKLSAAFNCTVVQAIGQSTVDTYYLSVHQEGRMVRKIHYGEDTIGVEHEGEPFPFEQLQLKQANPEEQFFDYEDMHDFCEHFGIYLMTAPSENDGHWTIIKIKEERVPEKESFFKKLAATFLGRRK